MKGRVAFETKPCKVNAFAEHCLGISRPGSTVITNFYFAQVCTCESSFSKVNFVMSLLSLSCLYCPQLPRLIEAIQDHCNQK